MSIIASELIARVTAIGVRETEAQLRGVGVAADDTGARLKGLAVGGTAIAGVALLALAGITTKMAADFQQGVNRLKTGGGDVQDSFKSLWTGIQKVADATGVLTGPLTDSMYLIVSAGQRGAQAFKTLTAAAQGAQIEQAKVKDVTQILTTLQSNFGIATYTAAQYMDGLVSAVSHGKITLEALSTAMSPILPMAHELGIHFADVSAAMSDMTNQGIPADQAATALRFTFQSMILPTKASQKAMQEWGLDSAKVAQTMKTSLPDALQMYIDAAKRAGPEGSKPFIDALSQMMGGGQRAAKALFSLDQTMGQWRTTIAQVNSAMGDTSTNVAGWDTAQSNLNIKLQEGLANLQTLGQNIGMVILPYVSQLLSEVTPLIGRFGDWFVSSGRMNTVLRDIGTALSTIGNVIGTIAPVLGTIIGAFGDAGLKGQILRGVLLTVAGAFAGLKIVEFGKTVAQVMDNAVLDVQYFGAKLLGLQYAADIDAMSIQKIGASSTAAAAETATASTGMKASLAGLGTAMGPIIGIATAVRLALGTLPTTAKGVFSDMGDQIDKFTLGPGGMWWMAHNAEQTTQQVSQSFSNMAKQTYSDTSMLSANALANFQKLNGDLNDQMNSMDAMIIGYWNSVADYISSHQITGTVSWTSTGGPISPGGPVGGSTRHFAEGTSYAPGGWSWIGERGPELAFIPRGAQIIPHTQSVNAASSGSGQPIQVNINIAGHNVARVLLPELVQGIRNATGAKF